MREKIYRNLIYLFIFSAAVSLLNLSYPYCYSQETEDEHAEEEEQRILDCQTVGGRWDKHTCRDIQNQTFKKCESLKTEKIKDLCFKSIAISDKNIKSCQKIKNKVSSGLCLGEIAAFNNDISICNNVEDLDAQEMCYASMAEKRKDPKICENIDTDKKRDWCYGLFASEGKPKLCENIEDQGKKDSCYYNAGEAGAGCKVCKKIVTPLWKNRCENDLRCANIKTIAACALISNADDKDYCYREVAVLNEDKSICMRIQDPYERDTCLIYLTRELNRYKDNDTSICGYVSNERKKECLEAAK